MADLLTVPLRLATDPAAEQPIGHHPDHRSPRWLGVLSLGLGALTVSQVVFAFEALVHLVR